MKSLFIGLASTLSLTEAHRIKLESRKTYKPVTSLQHKLAAGRLQDIINPDDATTAGTSNITIIATPDLYFLGSLYAGSNLKGGDGYLYDVGFNYVAIPAKSCDTCYTPKNYNNFTSTSEGTCDNMTETSLAVTSVNFGTAGALSGGFITDTVCLEDTTLNNTSCVDDMPFFEISSQIGLPEDVAGVLGLPPFFQDNYYTNFFQKLVDEEDYMPTVTWTLDSISQSWIDFGTNVTDEKTFGLSVDSNEDTAYWTVNITSIQTGYDDVQSTEAIGIFDTGSIFVYLPNTVYDTLAKKLINHGFVCKDDNGDYLPFCYT